MFDPSTLVELPKVEATDQTVQIDPAIMYPATIARIQECMTLWRQQIVEHGEADIQECAPELCAPKYRGGTGRAVQLMKNALAVPDDGWQFAMLDRREFYPALDYPAPIAFFESVGVGPDFLEVARQVNARGDALEVAVGWFLHALRLQLGGTNNQIKHDLRWRVRAIKAE